MAAVLREVFSPTTLEIVDDSMQHAGHSGAEPGGETHYSIRVVSGKFLGQSRLARSRAVHEALAPEFQAGLHALALTLRSPDETS